MSSALQVMNMDQTAAEWATRIRSCRSSGLSVRQWCSDHKLSPQTYYRWQRRLFDTNPEAQLEIADGNLRILTVFGDFLCEHRISTSRGHLVQNKSHLRDRTTALDQLQDSLDEQLNYRATEFLQRIREEKSRYARDQFRLLQSLLDRFGTEQMVDAISFCMGSNLCSANTVRDYLEHRAEGKARALPFVYPSQIPVNDPKYHITTQKQPLAVYAKVGGQV